MEIREVWVIPITAIPDLYQPKLWAGLKSIVIVHRIRHLWNKTTGETQYYLTSLVILYYIFNFQIGVNTLFFFK